MGSSQPEVADLLSRSILLALNTSHRQLALSAGKAMRYPSDIAPFAAIAENTLQAMTGLRGLLATGESTYLMDQQPPETPGLRRDGVVSCLQMLWPNGLPISRPGSGTRIESLDCTHAQEMMDLIAIAFPGYFRAATCRMGHYCGVRENGRLIAMGGERLIFEHAGKIWREISGLCTHPDHSGKGLGTALVRHILQHQKASGAISWLHVTEHNQRAIALYHHLGFVTVQTVDLHRIVRTE